MSDLFFCSFALLFLSPFVSRAEVKEGEVISDAAVGQDYSCSFVMHFLTESCPPFPYPGGTMEAVVALLIKTVCVMLSYAPPGCGREVAIW